MYLVSRPKPLPEGINRTIAEEVAACFPPGYLRFLRSFGEGTYSGWMNVQLPDPEVLKPFAEYGLWEHDADSPITERQIGECVAIGTTVDGDFLAVHPPTAGLIWLPRHGEQVTAVSLRAREQEDERTYASVLDEIYRQVYGCGRERAAYYEPWTGTRSHLFLRLPPGLDQLSLPDLSGMCRAAFPPDLSVETDYSCHLFYQTLGGYVRFNYANKQEVAVMYEQDAPAQEAFAAIRQWLVSKGCEPYSDSR
ncbi:hypothetical protein [Paenibacillus sp. UNC499MF]|uniref:hypothetical protein n=1 Tax=Paenibacillus sp. UNC499MF TaxID=1502751 RepID=UPI00089FCA8E|nr:hypothetical protein [Paenibacillus sp. UNC499MF]SEG24506.1 hypothetical protein SAMN02799616_02283 [Paenibacillus sp. UNC499MF]